MNLVPTLNSPASGDKAFTLNGQPADRAQVAAFVLPSSGGYAVGYKMAADMLVEAAKEDDRNPDLLFFPVANLYRHFLELSLKEIVRIGARSGAVSLTDKKLKELLGAHNLHCLWNQTRRAIEAVWPDDSRTETDAVQEVVIEFHRLDKSGQELRYATDKMSGKAHLSNAPPCVSLQNLKMTMHKVESYLDASCAGIDACDPGSP